MVSILVITKALLRNCKGFNTMDLQEIISFVVEKGETPLFLLLDGITDIHATLVALPEQLIVVVFML